MAHAFFKALLFLGAGNVMHAMHDELDPFKMGGLKKVMKWTWIMMTIASLALAGIFPFAGFFSKDTILEAAFAEHHYVIYGVLLFTAGLTAFTHLDLLHLSSTVKRDTKSLVFILMKRINLCLLV
jgi:NADH-quinone oxidoreductase subunit L